MAVSPAAGWPTTVGITGQLREIGREFFLCPLPRHALGVEPRAGAGSCSRAARSRLRRPRCRR
eukprot:4284034-Lingulodinium_polyedra.AAC.1